MSRRTRINVYQAQDGWRWRLVARNGRIVADSGEAYSTRHKSCSGSQRTRRTCC